MTCAELGSFEWSATRLGHQAQWPAGLAAFVATVLAAPIPMALAVGDDAVLVYNDAYARMLGTKHPHAFGRPAAHVLAENWDVPGHGDVVERVYRTGEPFYEPDTVLPVYRRGPQGPREMVSFSRAYTAVRGDDGRILAVLTVISETTELNRVLSGMADLTARLSAAATVDNVARETLRYAVEHLGADHARVLLGNGPMLRMARRARVDDDDTLDRLPPVWVTVPGDTRLPSVAVAASGSPLWLDPSEFASFPDLAREPLAPQNLTRIASVPLRAGATRGALAFAWETPGEFTATERTALTTVGNLVAQSLARAERFDEQLGVAHTLQLSMLPTSLPQLPGIGMAARYVPSGHGAAAGGDFYDAFETGGGIAVVIGDVVGHGVQAATVMGQVRAAARVLAYRDSDPAAVLAGLDPLIAGLDGETFVTMLVAFLDLPARAIRMACAGHPPPILCRRGSDASFRAVPIELDAGAPVGIAGPRRVHELQLTCDDILVLYTDGVTEVPGEDPDLALELLLDEAADAALTCDPRRICGRLLDTRRATVDDAAVLVLAVHDRQHRLAANEFPAEASSPSQARRWARSTLVSWGADGDVVDSALLGISELVSNAVQHAHSSARVELDLDTTRLLVLVTDTGTRVRPEPQEAEPLSTRGRGLNVVERLSDAWGTELSSRGTTVWFEITHPDGAAS